MKKWWWLISGLVLVSCKTGRPASTSNTYEYAPESVEKPPCKPVRVIPFQQIEDSLEVRSAIPLEVYQDGKCLRIRYQYSGCREGEALLVWNGFLIKSYPAQAQLVLYVTEAGECERVFEGFGDFDLNVLKQYTDSLVMLRFKDFDGRVPYYLERD